MRSKFDGRPGGLGILITGAINDGDSLDDSVLEGDHVTLYQSDSRVQVLVTGRTQHLHSGTVQSVDDDHSDLSVGDEVEFRLAHVWERVR